MQIKCKCGEIGKAHFPEKTPKGTVRIECNFCPECEDGDFYEEEFFNKDGKLINVALINH